MFQQLAQKHVQKYKVEAAFTIVHIKAEKVEANAHCTSLIFAKYSLVLFPSVMIGEKETRKSINCTNIEISVFRRDAEKFFFLISDRSRQHFAQKKK